MQSPAGVNIASLDQRAMIARLAIYGFIAFQLIDFALQFMFMTGEPSERLVKLADTFEIAGVVVFLVSAGAVLFWIHRAHHNLYEITPGPFEFTPLSAMGWYFVPLANMIFPFNAMRELWRESQGGPERGATESPLIVMWWTCFIGGTILARIGASVVQRENPDTLMAGLIMLDGGLLLRLASAVLLHEIIRAIGNFQRQWTSLGDVFD